MARYLRRSLAGLLALCLVLAGAARAELPRSPELLELHDAMLECVEAGAGRHFTGFCVQDWQERETLLAWRADEPMRQGRVQRLLTAAAALEELGPDFRYLTVLAPNAFPREGILRGDLVLRGGGDPSLGRVEPGRLGKAPAPVFREWAATLRELGIEHVTGRVIADDHHFLGSARPVGWPASEAPDPLRPETGAVNFNGNTIAIEWLPERGRNDRPETRIYPETRFVRLHSMVAVDPDLEEPDIRLVHQAPENIYGAEGKVPSRRRVLRHAAVAGPSLYAATVLRETLLDGGIAVDGAAVGVDGLRDMDAVTSGCWPALTHPSPPLAEILAGAMQPGGVLEAECVLRALGKRAGGDGSFESGRAQLHDYLARRGLLNERTLLLDGSGLSTRNALAARSLCGVLDAATHGAQAEAFLALLEAPFERPPLARAFRGLLHEAAGGGTALAGFLRTRTGRDLTLAICIEAPGLAPEEGRLILEQWLVLLHDRLP